MPREPELVGKIFTNDDNSLKQGIWCKSVYDFNAPGAAICTQYNFLDGKIHGKEAIIYPDGLVETWEMGKFVEILFLPYSQR